MKFWLTNCKTTTPLASEPGSGPAGADSPSIPVYYDDRGGWKAWGLEHLETGDIVFKRSHQRFLLGRFNLYKFF